MLFRPSGELPETPVLSPPDVGGLLSDAVAISMSSACTAVDFFASAT